MSGHGAPEIEPVDAAGLRVVVIAGTWHDVITDGLIAGAERVLAGSGASWRTVRVPGSFELPVAAKAALDAGKPVGFGVLTLDDEQQGIDRAGLPGSKEDKGAEAADAALRTAALLRDVRA